MVSRDRVWLIGGTQESRNLAQALVAAKLPVTVTVTTSAARDLYGPPIRVLVGQLQQDQMHDFLVQERIAVVLDASHPHAGVISQSAIAAAQQQQIPYLRFERPAVVVPQSDPQVTAVDSFETLLTGNSLLGERVLLTVGYRYLPLFQGWQQQSTLFARILPSAVALETALASGFSRDRIIALHPPLSLELEQALWQHWRITLVIAKASGQPGGELVKRAVAKKLGTPLVLIARPPIVYPAQTQDLLEAIRFCAQALPN